MFLVEWICLFWLDVLWCCGWMFYDVFCWMYWYCSAMIRVWFVCLFLVLDGFGVLGRIPVQMLSVLLYRLVYEMLRFFGWLYVVCWCFWSYVLSFVSLGIFGSLLAFLELLFRCLLVGWFVVVRLKNITQRRQPTKYLTIDSLPKSVPLWTQQPHQKHPHKTSHLLLGHPAAAAGSIEAYGLPSDRALYHLPHGLWGWQPRFSDRLWPPLPRLSARLGEVGWSVDRLRMERPSRMERCGKIPVGFHCGENGLEVPWMFLRGSWRKSVLGPGVLLSKDSRRLEKNLQLVCLRKLMFIWFFGATEKYEVAAYPLQFIYHDTDLLWLALDELSRGLPRAWKSEGQLVYNWLSRSNFFSAFALIRPRSYQKAVAANKITSVFASACFF